jgi:hypothetical protein
MMYAGIEGDGEDLDGRVVRSVVVDADGDMVVVVVSVVALVRNGRSGSSALLERESYDSDVS